MKLEKLIKIKIEAERFNARLKSAIEKAENDNLGAWVNDEYDYTKPKPMSDRSCSGTKESGSFKRAALDLKRLLSNL